jgi:anti-sigma factor RsiW
MSTSGGPFSSSFSEADLHNFVDGRLEPSRQMEMTRRLKSHPADRARTDAWREQNELIRATFSEVEGETLPVSLCLTAPARLRCVVSDGLPLSGQASSILERPRFASESNRRRARLLAITALMICAGLTGTWIMLAHPPAAIDSPAMPAVNGLEESLAGRTAEAMAHGLADGQGLPLAGAAAPGHRQARGLPVITIPDLTATGFTFTGASADQADPPALLLFYEDQTAQHIVIGIADASPAGQPAASGPVPSQHAVTWHKDGKTFALTGTIGQRRLNDIAAALQTSLGAGKAD